MWTIHGSLDLKNFFRHVTAHALIPYSYSADERYEEERAERRAQRRKDRQRDRRERDEFSDDSEDEYAERPPKMLEAPSSMGGTSSEVTADFIRDNRERRSERERDREGQYMSGGLGRREDSKPQGY